MEETTNLKSIVLSRQDFKENDSLVTFYSREKGKIFLVARGVKKINSKIAGHIEPISLVDLMLVKGRQYDYVGSIKSIDNFLNIKSDLDKLEIAFRILKIYKKLIKEGEADEYVFQLLCDSLYFLDRESDFDLNLFYNFFIIKFYYCLGFSLFLENCVICRKKIISNDYYLNISLGGLTCKKCSDKRDGLTISDNSVKMLRLALDKNYKELINIKINNEIKDNLDKLVSSFEKYYSY